MKDKIVRRDDLGDGDVICERQGNILKITVDRVKKRNAFTPKMHQELSDAFTALDSDPTLRAGVVTFAGNHSTAGLDLVKFAPYLSDIESLVDPEKIDPYGLVNICSKPIVMAVQGITYTSGIELMLAADIVIAAEDTSFAQLEPKRGLMAFGGATFRFVERTGWGNAMYHLLTGEDFDAKTALRQGLVQEVVATGTQKDRAMAIAELICKNAPLAVQATKKNANIYILQGEDAAKGDFVGVLRELSVTKDLSEGVSAMLEMREPIFKGK